MPALEPRMNELLQDYRPTLGGRIEDYFEVAYLAEKHGLAVKTALEQTVRSQRQRQLLFP
jgi:hypothetical protein